MLTVMSGYCWLNASMISSMAGSCALSQIPKVDLVPQALVRRGAERWVDLRVRRASDQGRCPGEAGEAQEGSSGGHVISSVRQITDRLR